MSNPAIFLDRDGVINENLEKGVDKWEDFKFIPNALKALEILAKLPNKIIIITNQGGIEKGWRTEDDVKQIHEKMKKIIQENNGRIDAIYFCPHIGDECNCRKPKPGLLLQAQIDFDIDLENSIFVGDKTADIKTGKDLGMTSILVKTGNAGKDGKFNVKPDYVENDILAATKVILKIFSPRTS